MLKRIGILGFFILFSFQGWTAAPKKPLPSVQECHSLLKKSFESKQWQSVFYYSRLVCTGYAGTPFAEEALYYQGVAYFQFRDYTTANIRFSEYLKGSGSPKFFDEVISYKFMIAEKYREGVLKNVGWRNFSQWVTAKENAIKIYDEIIHAVPLQDVAIRALFYKGITHASLDDTKEATDAFQQLIRRYPKHALAAESFLEIGKLYIKQCNVRNQNFDLLALAELNLKKFQETFPQDERVKEAFAMVNKMQEIYAKSLQDEGDFFAKKNKKEASGLYYSQLIKRFPQTKAAEVARKRLEQINKKHV